MSDKDPDVKLVPTSRVIEERSDFDRDLSVRAKDLGEDWGDGFFVDAEPVIVDRGPDGSIVRTTPLSERVSQLEEAPPEVQRPVVATKPLSREDRDKLVFILAKRLFDHYKSLPPMIDKFNPIYDGIPDLPVGAARTLTPRPGTQLYDATPQQVFDWLKRFVAKRVEITNKRQGWEGYRPTLSFKVD